MTIKSIVACELKSMDRLKTFQLPRGFKKVGLALLILSFVFLFLTTKGSDYRFIAKSGMLIGLLLISISREKIEDELISKLRMQSYTFAFIAGVVYSVVLPFVDYFVDLVIKTKEVNLKDTGDFSILWILLFVQVFYFELLKRLHK